MNPIAGSIIAVALAAFAGFLVGTSPAFDAAVTPPIGPDTGGWECTELEKWPMWTFNCGRDGVFYHDNPPTICCDSQVQTFPKREETP